jgi:hypothetical protein
MRKSMNLILGVLLFTTAPFVLSAQSAKAMDDFLAKSQADFATSVYVIRAAAGKAPDTASPAQAVSGLAGIGLAELATAPDRPMSLGEFSYIAMKAFDIPGGLLYTLLPGPRYATRELAYLKILSGTPDDGRLLSGEEIVRFTGRAADLKEAK